MNEPIYSEDDLPEVLNKLDLENYSSRVSPASKGNEDHRVPSEYEYLYKCNSLPTDQANRRQELLAFQKKNRNNLFDGNRGILEYLDCETHPEDAETCSAGILSLISNDSKQRKHKQDKAARPMLSEWLTEVPNDLESEWLVKLCPIGVRNLVIATKGSTKAYTKHGKLQSQFFSNLPGGNLNSNRPDMITILDTIYNKKMKTYFVLDVLIWKDQKLLKCTAACRFFWIRSKLSEMPVQEISEGNEFRFSEIPEFPAELSFIQEKLQNPFREIDEIVPLDGILFYHKETWYTYGITPLVGWLKPFMIPEILHIPVSDYFLHNKPANYVSMQEYISHSNKKHKKRADVVMKNDCNEVEDMLG